MPKALPVLRLQFEQWQIPCMVGIAFTVIEACPQAHVAVIEVPSTGLGEVGSARPGVMLAGRRPEDVRPEPTRMYRVLAAWVWWPFVGNPVGRRVWRQCIDGILRALNEVVVNPEYQRAPRQLTLPSKNVPLVECFNASKESGNDQDGTSQLHVGIQA